MYLRRLTLGEISEPDEFLLKIHIFLTFGDGCLGSCFDEERSLLR